MQNYQVRIYFEDTDCGGIVYHTNYIKYCERARSELFFAQGYMPIFRECGFVLKSLEADFCISARLGDLLEVRSELKEMKNASAILNQNIYRIYNALENRQCDELVFKGEITLAFVDVKNGKITKIPQQMREVLSHNVSLDIGGQR